MAIKITLSKYNWTNERNIFVTGFTWHKDQYIHNESFISLLKENCTNFHEYSNFTSTLSGQFSIIIKKEHEVWISSCQTWSYPVLFQQKNSDILISDTPESLQISEIDSFSKNYFLQFGVTPFQQTLDKEIKQIRPGESICLKENIYQKSLLERDYITTSYADTPNTNIIYQHLTSSFEKYFEEIKNKQILLPLTAGYDSRLLACLLAEFGHKNVLCATWGRQNNSETAVAKEVAKNLGFKHQFIEYNNKLIKDFTSDKTFLEYAKFAGHWSSMPYLQDYFAIKSLSEQHIIDKNTIAIPGHPGDFLRGSHLDNSIFTLDSTNLTDCLLSTLGTSLPIRKSEKKELAKYFKEYFSDKNIPAWKAYEDWDYEERQCKFISNSNQAYSFFGIDTMMPLFDKNTILFFQKISPKGFLREKRYNQTLEKHFFSPANVSFNLKKHEGYTKYQTGLKNKIITLTPYFLKTWYYPMNDNIFYKEITADLCKNHYFKHPVKPHFYNAYIIQWYLNSLSFSKKTI
jgi:asparagine synthase (glutamine-hydrolysing)